MGGKSSSLMQKVVSPVSHYMGYGDSTGDEDSQSGSRGREPGEGFGMPVRLANPFVLTRSSSMYFDEDGQVAHEFYVETPTRSKTKKGRRRMGMRRIYHNIFPQGEVPVDPPRLRGEIPAVMMEL
ncbi:tumor suppressor candidate 2-like [Lytechinus pictus]|uniref:tumor suppressor candidate 2-like n=1 Tax=Lytechinus pictus TaxID=7653 RepID=UPI00240D1211|nr:tumor suppressor candidate 2-like [Lytechinus pictus]XP_054752384.1 tumor suppressor candidate 2-like [Lytechinus pictus]